MLVRQFSKLEFVSVFSYLLIVSLLGACGGGGGSSNAESSPDSPPPSLSLDSPPPSLSIAPASSVILNWTAPVARSDESPLSLADIGGYRVYYGTVEGEYPYRIDVNDGTAVEVVINDLTNGTYYFVVTTCDIEGRESEYSEVAVKTI